MRSQNDRDVLHNYFIINNLDSEQKMNLGKTISEIRKQKRIKQKVLAERCKLSVPALCKIEKGKSLPSLKTFETLAEGLDVSQGYLIMMALEEEDIKPEKRQLFQMMKAIMI